VAAADRRIAGDGSRELPLAHGADPTCATGRPDRGRSRRTNAMFEVAALLRGAIRAQRPAPRVQSPSPESRSDRGSSSVVWIDEADVGPAMSERASSE
jgi:hypothetical protein